jgi:putative membrane protein
MPVLAVLAALVAAAIHVWFFVLESLTFSRPTVWGRFGLRSAEAAEAVRPMAFNQGFYNLFLAAGVVGGLLLIAVANDQAAGRAIVLFACACMAGAGVVLGSTNRRLASAAAIQAVPPLIAIVAAFVL